MTTSPSKKRIGLQVLGQHSRQPTCSRGTGGTGSLDELFPLDPPEERDEELLCGGPWDDELDDEPPELDELDDPELEEDDSDEDELSSEDDELPDDPLEDDSLVDDSLEDSEPEEDEPSSEDELDSLAHAAIRKIRMADISMASGQMMLPVSLDPFWEAKVKRQ